MTKAKKVIGCVQHDCAECKKRDRVYKAAMSYFRVVCDPSSFGWSVQLSHDKFVKACAAAKKGKKNGKG